jgi:hypothetical protein
VPARLTLDEIKKRILENSPSIQMVEESFVGMRTKCLWIVEGFTEPFLRNPCEVLAGSIKHPLQISEEHTAKLVARNKDASAQEKIRNTRELKTGYRHPAQNPDVKKKMTSTYRQRTGYDYPSQNPEALAKGAARYKQETGYGHPAQNPQVQQKMADTYEAKTGYRNPGKNPAAQLKARTTYFERTGYFNPFQNPDVLDKIQSFTSEGEASLLSWVLSLGLEASKKHFRNADGTFSHELDVYIPSLKLAVEYNGLYYHSEERVKRRYHLDKTDFCKSLGIRLIHVWEHDWLKRNQQVKNFLKSALGKNQIKIGARKTEARIISSQESAAFLEQNHIQGRAPKGSIGVGLFHEGALVSVASFGKPHRQNHGNQVYLNRFASKEGVNVAGGLTKLTRFFFKSNPEVSEIYTYVHRTLSDGESYSKAGWKLVKTSKPDYFYFNKNSHKVYSKQSRKKSSAKTPEGMTESEHARKDNLLRVWDCGKLKFRLTRPV